MINLVDGKVIVFQGAVSVEEAEELLDLLLKVSDAEIDLSECTHIHSAALQVLMAVNPTIKAWPLKEDLCVWLERALKNMKKGDGDG